MSGKMDYKKEYKYLYLPKDKPVLVEVPEIRFIMIEGKGNPNEENGEYQKAVELLYALSYTLKMSPKNHYTPANYFEYVVPPLEGLWWLADSTSTDFTQKDRYCWISMIRQPEFVTEDVFAWACEQVKTKKAHLETAKAVLKDFQEGLCVQLMHIGPYDHEPESIAKIESYIEQNGLVNDIGSHLLDGFIRRHHEIYLNDPRKTQPGKLKTVLRHPVRR
ncbi:GyrI-like domain-containing protein [Candidatus Contubernalis alkaliaceticus]|uniref:GyrI-like domain-containing protein n=1 Tax=Candidatus Contubernalis alkaliaceticus TaxID=338645 RepID=UPI001F4C3C67|nr:GyrI-like domain-containing protein [Candidatus Contubernalis alkalaceticus]UNC92272.1 GyrI-like domain-containing protein [Candidatus Contubernalis alkalaceticus]